MSTKPYAATIKELERQGYILSRNFNATSRLIVMVNGSAEAWVSRKTGELVLIEHKTLNAWGNPAGSRV